MLLEFAVQNFKSFKDLQVFSLEASTEPKSDDGINRIIEKDGYRVVKTKAIYGANASGKSNLILSLVAFWQILSNNLKEPESLQRLIPYRLDDNVDETPSYLQIVFLHEGVKYRYGFEATYKKVISEWLYMKKSKEVLLFHRENNEIKNYNKSQFKEGKELNRKDVNLLKDTSLSISVLEALNFPISSLVVNSILSKIAISPNPIKHIYNMWHMQTQYSIENDIEFKEWNKKLLHEIDSTIINIRLVKNDENPNDKPFTVVERLIGDNARATFLLETEEASGTQKIFDYSHVIYRSLKYGLTLILDEMDALLHPKLTRKIIELFQAPEAHPESQLIFVTHDTNIMDSDLLRRDQITFVEKQGIGWSEIFDLSDIKGVRAKDLFEKNYLKGNYGALPILNQMEKELLTKEMVDA